ncbi:hypothetical protein SCHPADRAFT_895949 [Schizopora paradoxa]|uniref:F-box domain-containing protein n=1 Tax=Schizopora paradoxa TaxID=27342 RepID=A0A0H2R8H6_9AGAM|nr:hypothetical protein SCHPADRAFT_895949 [Schizopora paradoxa]
MSPESEASEVLLALEKAARTPNFHLLDLNDVFGLRNWSAVRNIEADVDPFSDDLDNEIIDADLTSRFMASAFQIDAIVSMLNVLSSFANEIQSRLKQSHKCITEKLSKCINELPDELIATVFQFTVWEEGHEGGRQALFLSQISRRFREIALGTRSLWATLSSSNSTSQLETCISRAGLNEEYHAYIHYDSSIYSSGIYSFMDACQSSTSRWKTVTLTQDESIWVDDQTVYSSITILLDKLSSSLIERGLQLPMLEELDIRGHSKTSHTITRRDVREWAPNLRTLRCSYALFVPTAALTSVSTFDYTQIFSDRIHNPLSSLRSMLEFLSFLPNLITFSLELHSANELACNWAILATECPSIISFHLQLRSLQLKEELEPQASYLASLMNALRIPSLEKLTISLGFWDTRDEMDGDGWTLALEQLLMVLIPKHFLKSSRLKSLSYFLWLDRDTPLSYWEQAVPHDNRIFYIPLDRIFHIQNLTISSWFRVQFVKYAPYLRRIHLRERCRLRELKFIGCENMAGVDLGGIVRSLLCEFDVWEKIERVSVKNCKNLAYEDLMWIIGEEKLRYLDMI